MTVVAPSIEEIEAEKARRRLGPFCQLCWRRPGTDESDYVEGAHIDLICDTLEAVERGDETRVIFEVPPRHAKSEHVSRRFPPWYIGRNPDKEIILATYGQELTNELSRVGRESLREHGHIFDVEISDASSSVKRWEIAGRRGGLTAVGMGGPLTGRGAHVLIIDDPLKNAEEAMSEVIREKHWEWFDSTAMSRLTPDGAVILMATRWHEDDLIGRVLKRAEETGEQWTRIRLPALAEANDPLGRAEGEPLWPQRGNDLAWAEDLRSRVSPWVWAALYQQRPVPDEGGMFARQDFRYYTELSDAVELEADDGKLTHPNKFVTRHFITVDLATSLKQMADYTVVSEWQATRYSDLLLRNIQRQRIEGPDQADLIESVWRQSGAQKVIVEKIGYQLALIQELTRRGIPVVGTDPRGDKKERAIPASIKTKQHKFFIRRDMPGRQAFEDELLSFPLGEHDDQVDTFSYAAMEVAGMTEGRKRFRGGGGLEVPDA